MNSFYEYFAAQQKMAAFRQAKRMQRGVKLGYNSTVEQNTTKFQSLPISILTNDFSIEFFGNTYGSEGSYKSTMASSNAQLYSKGSLFIYRSVLGTNGVSWVIFERPSSGEATDDSLEVNWKANGEQEKFHLIITRQGTTIKAYINGELKATKEQSAVKDLGDLQLAIANSSDVGFVRVWNMCLSADDVTAHYNNGGPMGYVVPKLYRQFGPAVEPRAKTFEFNIGSPYSMVAIGPQKYPYDCFYRVDYVVEEWDYQPNTVSSVGFLGIGGAEVVSGNRSWYSLEQAKVGELQSFLVKMPGSGTPAIRIYGGNDDETVTARHLKVTINSITPVGLLAEYLPQNIMESRNGPEVEHTAETFEFNIGSPYGQIVVEGRQYPFDCIYRVDYIVNEWDFQPKVTHTIGFLGINGASIISGTYQWRNLEAAKIGELQSFFIKMPKTGTPLLNIYGDQDTEETTARHLKVTIKGITSVSVPISWLDSAKQLPLSDEYMEPLFQSIGGYDMAANGVPEILYNE